ncbi:hypothetical protein [Roseovarius sp. C03]|uniref:hypothetical protein n=1 Tax=Roseovarius sp. C03 TaxID=3449222 RepID=UPI003EDBEF3F
MELIYPINFEGHEKWLDSGYAVSLASGDVITRDGEVLGTWRVAYNPEAKPGVDDGSGCFEFIVDGQSAPIFLAGFASLDSRINQGTALSYFTRTIRDWHEAGS